MKKRIAFYINALTFVVGVVSLCVSVYGESRTKFFFSNIKHPYHILNYFEGLFMLLFFVLIIIAGLLYDKNSAKRQSTDKPISDMGAVLRILVKHTPDIVIFKDAEGRYLEINDSTLELFGFDKEMYKDMKRLKHDEMIILYGKIDKKCEVSDGETWEKGLPVSFTDTVVMTDGEERTYDVIKLPMYYPGGRRKGIVILARDIGRHSRAEEKLERKEKILRSTLNATEEGILVVDRNRNVLEANRQYYNMWGIPWNIYSLNSETANTGFIVKQLVDPDSFEAWINQIYGASTEEYHQLRLLDGRIIDVHSAPLMDKDDIIGMVWSFRDVSFKAMAEQKLRISEEKYRTLVELCPDGILLLVNEKIMFANKSGMEILGAKKTEDIYQHHISEFMTIEETNSGNHFSNVIKGNATNCMCDNKIVQIGGRSIEVEVICTAVPHIGECTALCIIRDMSANRKNEELKRRIDDNIKLVNETLEYDKIRTEYFANISHEIKTPLNVIIGTLQLFELIINERNPNENSDRLIRYTSIMKQNGFRLLRMFNNLIYITEIDSGFIEMNYHNYDLVPIVRDLLSASKRFIMAKGANLREHISCKNIELACDADKIRRILLNLLSNAIKFTEKGDDITVSIYSDSKAAYISVKDTGIGIQEDMKDIIFERFRMVDKSFTRRCEGSGIGLYLAKSLTELHGGSIEVKSEYGKGSEFIVKLPLWLVEADEIAAASEQTTCSYMDMASIEFSDIY